jgi:hypothetical protein
MADELLARLDEQLGRIDVQRTGKPALPIGAPHLVDRADGHRTAKSFADRFPLVEIFVCAQFLWGALLFIPGVQSYRAIIRALPYLSSVALIAPYFPRKIRGIKAPPSASFLVAALGLLVVNLLHPTTQSTAGVAQCVFQLAIAAPIFWAWKAVADEAKLLKAIRWIFLLSALSATLGVLQVYFPDYFMPPQFSALGLQLNESWVDSLSYEGADGRMIVRPPGLTDQPGGAAVAAAIAAVLGLGLTMLPRASVSRVTALAGAGVGLGVLYLTQVRSLLLMCVAAFVVMALLAFRRGRVAIAAWIAGGGAALVIASFIWAASIGGERVEQRFTDIAQKGAVQTFRENRGHFLSYTVGEMLDEFPVGAGVGRWGMMNVYFGDPTDLSSPPIYVEIQLTGWLLDGGVPMWIFYGGGLFAALATAYRFAKQVRSPLTADLATIVLGLMMLVVGMSFAGPVFNTQTGVLFWFMAGSLHGAGSGLLRRQLQAAA